MKKVISCMLTLALAATLCACADNPSQKPDVPDKPPVVTPTDPDKVEYGTLSVCDTYAWLGYDYPATEFALVYSAPGHEEELTYEYDDTAIELDAKVHTVKALKEGTYTVKATSEHYSAEFDVVCETVNKDRPDKAYDLYQHQNGDPKDWYQRVNNFASEWSEKGRNNSTTIFIGDSFFDVSGFWQSFYQTYSGKDALCWGIGATFTHTWETIIDSMLYRTAPKNIAVNIGTNDIGSLQSSADEIVSSLERIFTLMHDRIPGANLYWFTIAPRYSADHDIVNPVASEVNEKFSSWATGHKWLTVVDTAVKLKIDKIKPDGLHPNEDGYEIYVNELNASGIQINSL